MLAPPRLPASPQHLAQVLQPALTRAAARPGMDRYRKSFPALAHLWILVLHILQGSPSLRQTHATLQVREHLWRVWGLVRFVSRSQLARSSTSRPADGPLQVFDELVALARVRTIPDPTLRLLERVQVLDSTFLGLSAKLAPWSKHGRSAAGVLVQCGLDLLDEIPSLLVLHDRSTNDRRVLAERDLADLWGWTLILDMGYYAHRQFARLLDANVDFITRRYAPAVYQVLERWEVPRLPLPTGETITADLLIDLGSPNNRTGAVVPHLRLIQYQTAAGAEYEVLTSRHDLAAAEVIWLYRRRWRIELFFRMLKQQLGLIRPLGRSRQALWLTVVMVAVVAVLLVLVETSRPPDVSVVAWARSLAVVLLDHLLTLRL